MSWKPVVKLMGYFALALGAMMALPAVLGFCFGEEDAYAFLKSMAVCGGAGGIMTLACRKESVSSLTRRESILFVSLGWIVGAVFCALPYMFATASPGFNGFADAYFEAMSGLTTTGASVLRDVEAVAKCLLFWRSFTQWIGGMGIIVLFVAALPYLGISGKQMLKSEVPGPEKDGLRPRVIQTARTLWLVYTAISAVEVIALMLCGMNLFDSVCHMFSTMSTGGFSPKNASVGHYNSAPIALVITLFMILAGVNFSLYYMAITGRWRTMLRDPELRGYLLFIAGSMALIVASLHGTGFFGNIKDLAVHSLFQVVSIMTTTGFATTDFDAWPSFSRKLLLLLMFIGGCSGSTGGGLKVIRVMVIAKHASQSIFKTVHPEAVVSMRVGSRLMKPQVVSQILGFFAITAGIFLGGSLVILAFGHDIESSVSAAAATLMNIGPGLGFVGPTQNYAFFCPFLKLFLSFLMVAGRLEFFTVLVLFSRAFWKK